MIARVPACLFSKSEKWLPSQFWPSFSHGTRAGLREKYLQTQFFEFPASVRPASHLPSALRKSDLRTAVVSELPAAASRYSLPAVAEVRAALRACLSFRILLSQS